VTLTACRVQLGRAGFRGGKGVWLQSFGVGVAAHELGHNYGLFHANFWNTLTNYSMIGPGTNSNTATSTIDGAGFGGHNLFNACIKTCSTGSTDAVQTSRATGCTIYPFDVRRRSA